eukprot:TRINITY_DN3445_c0_g1_i1.p2 TRINITY_DN3445_c0_g1~~TRINITY_DN3445_c0_g1_i1.p2  ORF type:complete len:127 (-),score=42.69 TRINITY_DN3445_c0_g1_i1:45-425(-)
MPLEKAMSLVGVQVAGHAVAGIGYQVAYSQLKKQSERLERYERVIRSVSVAANTWKQGAQTWVRERGSIRRVRDVMIQSLRDAQQMCRGLLEEVCEFTGKSNPLEILNNRNNNNDDNGNNDHAHND